MSLKEVREYVNASYTQTYNRFGLQLRAYEWRPVSLFWDVEVVVKVPMDVVDAILYGSYVDVHDAVGKHIEGADDVLMNAMERLLDACKETL